MLGDLLGYLGLKSFSLEALHEALTKEEGRMIPLVSGAMMALVRKVVNWVEEEGKKTEALYEEREGEEFFGLVKYYFRSLFAEEKEYLTNVSNSVSNRALETCWLEILIQCLGSKHFESLRD